MQPFGIGCSALEGREGKFCRARARAARCSQALPSPYYERKTKKGGASSKTLNFSARSRFCSMGRQHAGDLSLCVPSLGTTLT